MNTPQFILLTTFGNEPIAVNVFAIATVRDARRNTSPEIKGAISLVNDDESCLYVCETFDEVLAKIAALREPVQNKLGDREVAALERLAAAAERES